RFCPRIYEFLRPKWPLRATHVAIQSKRHANESGQILGISTELQTGKGRELTRTLPDAMAAKEPCPSVNSAEWNPGLRSDLAATKFASHRTWRPPAIRFCPLPCGHRFETMKPK